MSELVNGSKLTRRDRRSRSTRRALILAAGVGRRLWPETKDRPKCLVDLAGKPILLRLLEGLLEVGVDEWVFVTGYREEMIHDALRSWRLPSHSIQFVRNEHFETTNTLVSVGLAAPLVEDRDFLLLNADLWVRSSALKRLVAGESKHSMLVDSDVQLDDEAMKVVLDDTGRIRAISKQLEIPVSAGESIGAYRFDRESGRRFLARINHKAAGNDARQSYYEAALDELFREGLRAEIVRAERGTWAEIDDHDDLARARAALMGLDAELRTSSRAVHTP